MRMSVAALGIIFVAIVTPQLPAQDIPSYGEMIGGFPNWEERSIHEYTNRARVAPSVELAACTQCGPAELSGCYLPIAPLTYSAQLNESARFHSQNMSKINFFAHDTPCVLRTNIATLYPETCDASFACACSGTGTTSTWTRINFFGATGSGENIAYGYSVPKDVFYAWLLEPAPTSPCSFNMQNGHRWSILKNTGPGLGIGVFYGPIQACGDDHCPVSTQDFGTGTAASTIKLVSGSHWTPNGDRQGTTVEFWANWTDSAAPTQARVNVNGVNFPLTLARGTATNGAWTTSLAGYGTGCHLYYFSFRSSVGTDYTYPTTGSFGLGPAGSCADWTSTRLGAATGVKGDLNSDLHADLIWRNSTTGANSFWLINDTTVVGGGSMVPVADLAWKLGGTGDFNSDGKTDLLWHHDTGANTVWFMNGTDYSSQTSVSAAAVAWKPSGVGDFDGNGQVDIVWRNSSTGENSIWLMNGTAVAGGGGILPVSDLTWQLIGAGDVNNDGKADLIWWNSVTGSVSCWFMNSTTRTGSWFVGGVTDTNWRVSAVGDYNGDGFADILWRNNIGGVAIWYLNGLAVLGGGFVGQVADTNWNVAGPR